MHPNALLQLVVCADTAALPPCVRLGPGTHQSHLIPGSSMGKPRHQQHVTEPHCKNVQVGLEEYLARMKPDQKQIYYLSGARPRALFTCRYCTNV